VSRDGARTFAPVLKFAELCGQTACGADTDVGKMCPDEWPVVAPTLGATCGLARPDAGAKEGGTLDASLSNGDAAEAPRSPVETHVLRASGGCSLCTTRPLRVPWCVGALLALSLRFRRRRFEYDDALIRS
jgi:hypothetical protein